MSYVLRNLAASLMTLGFANHALVKSPQCLTYLLGLCGRHTVLWPAPSFSKETWLLAQLVWLTYQEAERVGAKLCFAWASRFCHFTQLFKGRTDPDSLWNGNGQWATNVGLCSSLLWALMTVCCRSSTRLKLLHESVIDLVLWWCEPAIWSPSLAVLSSVKAPHCFYNNGVDICNSLHKRFFAVFLAMIRPRPGRNWLLLCKTSESVEVYVANFVKTSAHYCWFASWYHYTSSYVPYGLNANIKKLLHLQPFML